MTDVAITSTACVFQEKNALLLCILSLTSCPLGPDVENDVDVDTVEIQIQGAFKGQTEDTDIKNESWWFMDDFCLVIRVKYY